MTNAPHTPLDSDTLSGKKILLIVTGGIAAYKVLDLVRMLKREGADVTGVMTEGAKQFITPLSLASLTGNKVYDRHWSLTDETEMGHIQLSRIADLVLVAPATANFIAKMAGGIADDLASTLCLASNKPIMVAPAMNVQMWNHPATQSNLEKLGAFGVDIIHPAEGAMACGEWGEGRLPEPAELLEKIRAFFGVSIPNLKGKKAIVTAGPTVEAIDPVRYISNHSSGKQGYAIAEALSRAGVQTTLISGPTQILPPPNVRLIRVQSASEMMQACQDALPVDIAVCCAAVADWKIVPPDASSKTKKKDGKIPTFEWAENPDILHTLSHAGNRRPQLVVGFAAETDQLIENAKAKIARKGCDLLCANDVSVDKSTFGGDRNKVFVLSSNQESEEWPEMGKKQVARRLVEKIATYF